MKANHVWRKLLLLAHLCISFCPVDAAYAVDPVSCDPIIHAPLIVAEMERVATIAKFVSLNLGNNDRANPATNPQGWYYDDYVRAQVELLMGDTQDAINQAQWVFGGAVGNSGAGIAGMSATKINKGQAGPYDQVIYCNVNRLSQPNEHGYVLDPDSLTNALFFKSQVALCTDEWEEGAPAYVFWQISFDAARISFCGWYLDEIMRNQPPDLRKLTAVLQRLSAAPGSAPTWNLPQGVPGAGQIGRPSIENFQMFDATMMLALTHTGIAGSRRFSQQDGGGSAFSSQRVTWAGAVTAATRMATRYSSEAFMFLALDILSYRSGFQLDASGRFSTKSNAVTGIDWGNPSQQWALAWRQPFG